MTTILMNLRGGEGRRAGRGGASRAVRLRRGGFTLLELAISLTLLATVIIGLNRFALGGLQAASTNIEVSDLRRQTSYARNLLEADLAQARACDPSGYGSPFLRLDTVSAVRRFAVYTTATATGRGELVEWRFYPDGTVYRLSTVADLQENLCDAAITLPIGDGNSIQAAVEEYRDATGEEPQLEIVAAGRNMFQVQLKGTFSSVASDGSVTVEEKGTVGLCTGWDQATCYADRLSIEFVLITGGFEPVTNRIAWELDVDLENART